MLYFLLLAYLGRVVTCNVFCTLPVIAIYPPAVQSALLFSLHHSMIKQNKRKETQESDGQRARSDVSATRTTERQRAAGCKDIGRQFRLSYLPSPVYRVLHLKRTLALQHLSSLAVRFSWSPPVHVDILVVAWSFCLIFDLADTYTHTSNILP